MIVDNLNFFRPILGPAKAHSVLVVNPYAVLSLPISAQPFETVARRETKVFQLNGGVEHVELAIRVRPQFPRKQLSCSP